MTSQTASQTRKSSFLLFALLVIGTVAVDQWGRSYVRTKDFLADFPWIRFELHWNEGFFGGTGSGLNPLFNQVFLSSLSLLIIALLALFGFIYRKDRIAGLREGLWMFGVGLFSNVLDRIFLGKVTDWVIVKRGGIENYAFNLADILIGCGIVTLSYLLIFRSERFWHESVMRDKVLIERRFQFGLALFLVKATALIAVGLTLASLIFFRLFLLAPETPIRIYGGLLAGAFIVWALCAWVSGLAFSRNLFGPVLAIESLIVRALKGKTTERDRDFHLRKEDSFQNLSELGRDIVTRSLSDSEEETSSPDKR